MKIFKRIVIPEINAVLSKNLVMLQKYSEEKVVTFDSNPSDDAELIRRIDGADCILVGWASRIGRKIISSSPKLCYIGLAATLYPGKGSNIDLDCAGEHGIDVRGITSYGEVGVHEFVISEIVQYLKDPRRNMELKGKCVGIIGAGETGGEAARFLNLLGAEVVYYSRRPKPALDALGISRLGMDELLEKSVILSFHLPRNIRLLGQRELGLFGNGGLIINTSLGLPVDEEAMLEWLSRGENSAVFDSDGAGGLRGQLVDSSNVKLYDGYAGFTSEAEGRLVEKVEANIIDFLNKNS